MNRAILRGLVFVCFVILANDLASTSARGSAASDHIWKSYTNVRFQFTICYPEDLLVPQGEAPNSDGQKFQAKDGGQLIVFGQNNALDESLSDKLHYTATRLKGASGKITYEVIKPNWFVVSGQSGQTIFYAKTFYSRNQFKSFELSYNQSTAAVYEPWIGRLSACFADLAP
jgi:hypothetical protein